jgi:hypothetical protein
MISNYPFTHYSKQHRFRIRSDIRCECFHAFVQTETSAETPQPPAMVVSKSPVAELSTVDASKPSTPTPLVRATEATGRRTPTKAAANPLPPSISETQGSYFFYNSRDF